MECKKPIVSIIAAIGENRELGKDNKLLWRIKKDLAYFKEKTSGHSVIMGRKTYESIGRPLPNRTNIVITSRQQPAQKGVVFCSSLEEAIQKARKHDQKEIFIIGGASVYEQALKYANRLYLTLVEGKYKADVFFPEYSQFKKILFQKKDSEQNYRFTFLILEKRKL